MSLKKELGFVTVVAMVIGNQIGAGAFSNPSVIARFKFVGLIGLIVAALGAISLSLVFAKLSIHFSESGGPQAYVSAAFGRHAGFFTAWVYWIISWLSNAVLLSIIVGYLLIMPFHVSSLGVIFIETLIVLIITYINAIGVSFSGKAGVLMIMLKLGVFLVLPLIFFSCFELKNFDVVRNDFCERGNYISELCNAILLGFFGFIGVESGTAATQRVENPEKLIPKALIVGTVVVSFVYILNVVSMIGVVGFEKLAESNSPYALAIEDIFCNQSQIFIAIISILVCLGTLNSWTLTSGQIAYVAYKEGLFPKIFGKINKAGAPIAAIVFAAFGMIVCFFIQQTDSLKDGLLKLLNISVSIFLYVYLLCCVSYIKLIKTIEKTQRDVKRGYILSIFSIIFCLFVLTGDVCFENGFRSLFVLVMFVVSGVPVFLFNKNFAKKNT